jgi:hypothetical protein
MVLNQFVRFTFFILGVVILSGCDVSPPTKIDAFRNQQKSTVTPHGPIDMQSVQETSDGNIQYKTSDGTNWSVTARDEGAGVYRFESPRRVKDQ